jgi:hypothetical protein
MYDGFGTDTRNFWDGYGTRGIQGDRYESRSHGQDMIAKYRAAEAPESTIMRNHG